MEQRITEEQFDEVANELVVAGIDDVLSGNADNQTIRDLIGLTAAKLMNNELLPEKYRRGLAYALYHISKGEDPAVAFGLKKPHKSKGDPGLKRSIALSVLHSVNFHEHSIESACILTGKKFSKSPSTVQEIYYKYKKEIEMKLSAVPTKSLLESSSILSKE